MHYIPSWSINQRFVKWISVKQAEIQASSKNELVVKYNETALYYLGERNTDSDIESFNYTEHMKKYGIKNPRVYKLNNLDDVVNLVNMFGDDEED